MAEKAKKKIVVFEEKLFSKKFFVNYSILIIGSLLVAAGYVFFLVPYKIVPGGLFGLGMIINALTGLPIGMTAMVLNIPLLIWGVRLFNASFSFKTIIGIFVSSVGIDVMMYFWEARPIANDILVSAVFGGVVIGGALALVIRTNATTGGTDLIARIVTKYTKIPVGKNLLVTDGLIILLSIIVFRDINLAPYALISIFSISRTIDAVLTGLDDKKAVFIISDKHEDIRNIILDKMDRGGTYLMASGLYHREDEKKMIFSALSRREMAKLQSHIKVIDPNAFITVVDTHEIIGSGFKPFE